MKYSIIYTRRFEKDVKICQKRGLNISLLEKVVAQLAETGHLPDCYQPHKLQGKYKGLWECHLRPDWLLVWSQNDKDLLLLFTATGTHADLFG